jgi:hypothetical protein
VTLTVLFLMLISIVVLCYFHSGGSMSLAFIRPVKKIRKKKHKIGPKVSVCIAGELKRLLFAGSKR